MATAIRNVELSAPATDLDALGQYERCMLVFRWRGAIVGRAFVPVTSERVDSAEVSRQASDHLGRGALRAWIEDALQFDERRAADAGALSTTVAICTRERPDDLDRTLSAVCRLLPAPREVVVVDNAPSTTRTRAVVERYPGVRYIVEPTKGLNRARNRALREASGEIVAFTDDDACPEEGWLAGLLANFADNRVLCVTGLTLPSELETPAQELFEDHCPFARGFVRRVFNGRIDHPLLVSRVGAGANMAVRRALHELVGWFDERLDAGTPSQSGGDHEMFTRILGAGYRIVYEPRAVSWHRHRRTFDELRQVVRGYGTGVYAMWTGLLVEHRDLGVLRLAWRWFRHDHLPLFLAPSRLRASGGRDALRSAELRGCLSGPWAWFTSSLQRRAHA
jgi:glycosyltransferase involved in cell wall biosynthesis